MLYTNYTKPMGISGIQTAIDIFFLILCLRIVYIAVSRGAVSEIFKVVGLLTGSLLSFHYYYFFATSISNKIIFVKKEYLYFVAFILIFFGTGFIFSLIRLIVSFLFKREKISFQERWILFFVGGARVAFLASVMFFSLYLSPLKTKYFENTITYSVFKNIAPKVYLMAFEGYSYFNPAAKLNKEVVRYHEIKRPLSKSNKKRN